VKKLIILITFLSVTLSARAEDFTVLWEMDISPFASQPIVSDDGKYFYYHDSEYVKFHDSETGVFLHQINQGELNKQENGILYLNDNKVVLPFSLDSILIYNIATKQTEATIDLGLNVENPPFYRSSISPNKRFLTLYCRLNGSYHFIIVDLEEQRLFKDVSFGLLIGQLFNTNDPKRMIVTTSDQFGIQLVELTLDETAPLGYRTNMIEEVDKEGEIRGQKYDADEDAFYYLYLPYDLGKRLSKYEFQNKKVTNLYEGGLGNRNNWFSQSNQIILFEYGYLYNLNTEEWFKLRQVDNIHQLCSSSDGLKTVLLRIHNSIDSHTLKRFDVESIISSVNNEDNSTEVLYPNPTTGNINLVVNNQHTDIFSYKLYNGQGQIIFSDELGFLQVGSNTVNIQLPSISKGIYLLKIESVHEVYNFNLIME